MHCKMITFILSHFVHGRMGSGFILSSNLRGVNYMCVCMRALPDRESSSLCTMFFVNFYSRLCKLLDFITCVSIHVFFSMHLMCLFLLLEKTSIL